MTPVFRIVAAACLLSLTACATAPSPSVPGDEVDTRVRQPAQQDSAGIQVFPLENPAVSRLMSDATAAEDSGDYEQAIMLLERAMHIQPRNPEVLQSMAEVQLQVHDWEQALGFATRSYDLGPRVGEICSRNWRTISVSREYLGDRQGARQAEQKARSCMITKPEGF